MRLAKIIAILYTTMNLSGCGIDVTTPFSPSHLNTSFDHNKASYIQAANGMADPEKRKQDEMRIEAENLRDKVYDDFLKIYNQELDRQGYKNCVEQ